jgi:hypothetical protein
VVEPGSGADNERPTAQLGDPAVAFDLPEVDGVDLPAVLHVPSLVAFAGEAAAGSLARRVKAVACTAPLHDLEANKVHRGGGAWAGLNCWELAFVAIDTVATRMDFDAGVPYEDVIAVVAAQAEHQVPGLGAPQRRDVGAWVVDGLQVAQRDGEERVGVDEDATPCRFRPNLAQ